MRTASDIASTKEVHIPGISLDGFTVQKEEAV